MAVTTGVAVTTTMVAATTMMVAVTTMGTTEPSRLRTLLDVLRSVRVRVLTSVLLLTTLGMVAAGVAVFLVQNARIDARIKEAIAQEVNEFEQLQDTGIDPQTGRPFRSMERLFEVALERNVPDEHQGLLAVIEGRVRYHSAGRQAAELRNHPVFLSAVRDVVASSDPTYREVVTDRGHFQIAVKPVVQGARTGAWVVAYGTDDEEAEFADVVATYALVAVGVLLLVAAVGWLVAGRLLAPIRGLRRTAEQITQTDLTRRIEVTGRDDVSALTQTFNAMLDRLDEAFTVQREFLDDAGHELRTPIAIVRGHLELLETSDPEVAETKLMLIDELDRMARMVDELVTLAKAQRPDFLRLAPVDLATLAQDVYDKTLALAPRAWELEIGDSGTVVADPQRLTQALLQLAQNAVTHTNDGDLIAIGSEAEREIVRLWVRDTGPGIHPDDSERIFGRWSQGRDGRGEDGTGLGLAIVHAIAEAHGGRVVLDSRPGSGATFTLEIPR